MRSLVLAMLWLACTPALARGEPPPKLCVPYERPNAVEPVTKFVAAALPARAVPAGLTVAAHGAEIALLAVTDDDGVAVTVDRRGSMRLWPSLDGTREPVIVETALAPEQLAVVRDGQELVIAAAGPLGQVELIRTRASGEPVSRVRIDLERTLVALHATARGFVGLRDDQTLAGVDLHGGALGLLRPSPGERIATLASRRGRLLAVVRAAGDVRARWIEAKPQLAWGSASARLAIDPSHVALAPDHARLAAMSRDRDALLIVRLNDGHLLAQSPRNDYPILPARPLGFVGDAVAAIDPSGTQGWWRPRDQYPWIYVASNRSDVPAVVTDRHLVSAAGGNLALADADGVTYLGFRLVDVSSAVPSGDGWRISAASGIVELDGHLAGRKRYRRERNLPSRADGVLLLDDRHWVLRLDGHVYLGDLEHPDQRELLGGAWRLQYEPTTRLMALSCYRGQWIGRYDPAAGRFRETLVLPESDRLELLDPELQGGVARDFIRDDSTVQIVAIRDIDFAADPPLRAGSRIMRTLPEGLRTGVPHAARMREPAPDDVATAMAELLPALARHRTSPDGARIAIVGGGRVSLRDRKGRTLWAVALPGVADVAWRGPRELVAFGSGMVRLDVATGAARDRRCGWDFGLWAEEDTEWQLGAGLCEAPGAGS